MEGQALWEKFQAGQYMNESLGLALIIAVWISDRLFQEMEPAERASRFM